MDQRLLSLRDCKYFVLDEVDEMFSMGFIEDIKDVIAAVPEGAQGVFASATVDLALARAWY